MTGAQIRELFLKYFEENGHQRVRSSSLVPPNDPTLFFTNAGMVQFKELFLGNETRSYSRATSTQKCMRVSGKHNDLENVGRTARHHTFFEMLGNFSFGDYFKPEAIRFGWEFLTEKAGLDPERLVATVFTEDDEAYGLWQEIAGVPAERIYKLGEKDNFWAMGDTGPCGPCSEILIDQGEKTGCQTPECGPDCDCGRFLELWNLVFMQYDRDETGTLSPLPKPSIDTGMGLERLAAVLQGEDSNYHTDLVFPFVEEAARVSGVRYGSSDESDVSLRVIADHVRAVTFLVADGVLPSNEGRGYVLRRIMRRAARHGKLVGLDDPFLSGMCPLVADVLGEAFPEVPESMKTIQKVVHLEEERFGRTLDQGLLRLSQLIDEVKTSGLGRLPGEEVFRLYDTFGFPLDLSEDIASESGLVVDIEGFNQEMEKQKDRARASWSGSGSAQVPRYYRDALENAGSVVFTGYEEETTRSTVIRCLISGDRLVESCSGGEDVEIILDRTPFYGESGGQVGDTGVLTGDGFTAEVFDTIKPLPELTVHRCRIREGTVQVGDRCTAEVDHSARSATRRNHTATHLLHAALREIAGEHVQQSGSLVEPERFRFDFTHFEALTDDEILRLEDKVNADILENSSVVTMEMSPDQAVQEGAMALFGEKYGEKVRVVSIPGVSMELCGGTHVSRTGDIGLLKIIHEGSIAAGVRRIEGITGIGVLKRLRSDEDFLKDMASSMKVSVAELPGRLQRLQETVQEKELKIRELMSSMAGGGPADLKDQVREVAGIKYLAAELPGHDASSLRQAADRMRDQIGSGVVLLATRDTGKVALVVTVTKDLMDKLPAGRLVASLAPIVGGGGGGRPDMAQAGGKDPDGLPKLLDAVDGVIREMAT
ncbi:MAG: alanine--tRNA ligase [Pseudomonadota bacterium]